MSASPAATSTPADGETIAVTQTEADLLGELEAVGGAHLAPERMQIAERLRRRGLVEQLAGGAWISRRDGRALRIVGESELAAASPPAGAPADEIELTPAEYRLLARLPRGGDLPRPGESRAAERLLALGLVCPLGHPPLLLPRGACRVTARRFHAGYLAAVHVTHTLEVNA